MKICLHNKTGQKPTPGYLIKLPRQGNCFDCTKDSDNNDCRLFYSITIFKMEVEDETKSTT